MINHIVVLGRICNDITLNQTKSGVSVASFCVAVDRDYQPKDGGEKQTDFFSVTCWRGTAEFVAKYLGKGRMVAVEGRMESSKFTDKDGISRTSWAIQAQNINFADSKRSDTGGSDSSKRVYTGAGGSDDARHVYTGDVVVDTPSTGNSFSEIITEDSADLPF